jgi:hypothetical protein
MVRHRWSSAILYAKFLNYANNFNVLIENRQDNFACENTMVVRFTTKTVVGNPNIILVMRIPSRFVRKYVLTIKTLHTEGYEKIKKGYTV